MAQTLAGALTSPDALASYYSISTDELWTTSFPYTTVNPAGKPISSMQSVYSVLVAAHHKFPPTKLASYYITVLDGMLKTAGKSSGEKRKAALNDVKLQAGRAWDQLMYDTSEVIEPARPKEEIKKPAPVPPPPPPPGMASGGGKLMPNTPTKYWSFAEGLRTKGPDAKYGNIELHVPWVYKPDQNASIQPDPSPDWASLPKVGTWLMDRYVVGSYRFTPDGAWQFGKVFLSKEHVPGKWAQDQTAARLKPQYDAMIQYYDQQFHEQEFIRQFGYVEWFFVTPSAIEIWWKQGHTDNLNAVREEVQKRNDALPKREVSQAELERIANLPWYSQWIELGSLTKEQREIVYNLAKNRLPLGLGAYVSAVSETGLGRVIVQLLGVLGIKEPLSEKELDKLFPNTWPWYYYVIAAVALLAGVIAIAQLGVAVSVEAVKALAGKIKDTLTK